jgi:hypothetical protein
MIRKLMLVIALLAVAAVPAQAREREFRGGHERFERHERFEHRGPVFGFYGPACSWQAGYWVNQPYVDVYGNYTYAPQWVPPQYVCD